MRHPPVHFFEFTPDTLSAWCVANNMPRFRAKQILNWVYAKGITDPAQMTNLSHADRQRLRAMTFESGFDVRAQRASDDTQKLLVQWREYDLEGDQQASIQARSSLSLPLLDANPSHGPTQSTNPQGLTTPLDPRRQTECVMIPADRELNREPGQNAQHAIGEHRSHSALGHATDTLAQGAGIAGYKRRTACISSQVGCPVGCKFCASGLGGLDGNLSAGRIVEQVYRLARMLDSPGQPGSGRITNVVFMGMGEPLANIASVMSAVRTLAAPWGMGISARKITISTVGLPKAIERLAEELDLPVTLALSLHAPNDTIRRELIPWAEYTTIEELLGACRKWFERTGREITLEYILLRGVNDRPQHARELARVAKTLRGNVNLIRYNQVRGLPFERPIDDDVLTFQEILQQAGVNAHIRASRGRDIAAACGQLRHEKAVATA